MDDMVHCRGCGKEIHKTAMTCPHCGASQRVGRNKSKLAAGLIAIFIGGLGIHRFYLGQWWGIFYLLFWITGLPSIVSIIEGIVFLATSNHSWDDKYNSGITSQDDSGGAVVIIIAVVVGGFFFIAVIGILAAIAIPQYQDYIVRARVQQGYAMGQAAKPRVAEYVLATATLPADNTAIGLPLDYTDENNNRVEISNGIITIFIGNAGASEEMILTLTPIQIPGQGLSWSCTALSGLARHLPADCRG